MPKIKPVPKKSTPTKQPAPKPAKKPAATEPAKAEAVKTKVGVLKNTLPEEAAGSATALMGAVLPTAVPAPTAKESYLAKKEAYKALPWTVRCVATGKELKRRFEKEADAILGAESLSVAMGRLYQAFKRI